MSQLPNIPLLKLLIFRINDWFKYLFSKWLIILTITIIFSGINLYRVYNEKWTYFANITYVLNDDKADGGILNTLSLANSLGVNLDNNNAGLFNTSNLIELMHSRSLIEKTLLTTIIINKKNTTFADFYIDMKELRKGWLNNDKFKHLTKIYFPINADRSNFSFYQDSILSTIYTSINKDHLSIVNKDKKNSIVTVEIKSKNEYFSKYFCESLVKNVSDFYITLKSKKASTNLDILQMQADSLKKELNYEVSSVSSSTDNIFNINPSKSFKKISITNHQINVQINTIILKQLLRFKTLNKLRR